MFYAGKFADDTEVVPPADSEPEQWIRSLTKTHRDREIFYAV